MSYHPIINSNASSFNIVEMLSNYNRGEFHSETIKLCVSLVKINKRNKKQQRLLVFTDKAIYNIKSKQIKRRIVLSKIAAITKSSTSTEFTINIPSEYDYRFDAKDKAIEDKIISVISQSVLDLHSQILVNIINEPTTAAWTVTKKNLKTIEHENETVRTVMALDHLDNMGFKSKRAFRYLKSNNGNLSGTIQALVGDYVSELEHNEAAVSPFTSQHITPHSSKIGTTLISIDRNATESISANELSPLPSKTTLADDAMISLQI